MIAAAPIDGITFCSSHGKVYLPLTEASSELGWPLHKNKIGYRLNHRLLDPAALRWMTDGTALVSVDTLVTVGASLSSYDGGPLEVLSADRRFSISAGKKRVEISLENQQLQAWQGDRLVLTSRVSSGRRGSTPSGSFTAGPYRARMHYSSRYQNAPMPWSVQIHRHVFIHGFTSVPDYPASHGCIRLPLTDGNPARSFYDWDDAGTPVRVSRQ